MAKENRRHSVDVAVRVADVDLGRRRRPTREAYVCHPAGELCADGPAHLPLHALGTPIPAAPRHLASDALQGRFGRLVGSPHTVGT